MADSPQSVTRARYALTLRLAHHVEWRQTSPAPPDALARVIDTTNDLMPLWSAYEASVRAEALRDVRADVWATVRDRLDTMLSRTSDPVQIDILDGLLRWAQREQTTPAVTRLTPALAGGGSQ